MYVGHSGRQTTVIRVGDESDKKNVYVELKNEDNEPEFSYTDEFEDKSLNSQATVIENDDLKDASEMSEDSLQIDQEKLPNDVGAQSKHPEANEKRKTKTEQAEKMINEVAENLVENTEQQMKEDISEEKSKSKSKQSKIPLRQASYESFQVMEDGGGDKETPPKKLSDEEIIAAVEALKVLHEPIEPTAPQLHQIDPVSPKSILKSNDAHILGDLITDKCNTTKSELCGMISSSISKIEETSEIIEETTETINRTTETIEEITETLTETIETTGDEEPVHTIVSESVETKINETSKIEKESQNTLKESKQIVQETDGVLTERKQFANEIKATTKVITNNEKNTMETVKDLESTNEANETSKTDVEKTIETKSSFKIEAADQSKREKHTASKVTFKDIEQSSIDSSNVDDENSQMARYKSISYEQLSSDMSGSDEVKIGRYGESSIDDTSRDELSEIENFDFSSCGEDSLEAMYYSLRKNEVMLDKMHKRVSEQRSSAKADEVEKDENIEKKSLFPEKITDNLAQVKREMFDRNQSQSVDSNTSDNDDVIIGNLAADDTPYFQKIQDDDDDADEDDDMNPMTYAMKQKEAFLEKIHGNNFDTTINLSEEETFDNFSDQHITDGKKSNYIKRKMWASSVSETDSDYIEPTTATRRLQKDDFNISTAFDRTAVSQDSDSTIVSAATKIQAGARGFLTRRRLRRPSAGGMTMSMSADRHCSFGNAAIDKSLEDLIEQQELLSLDEAATKIQKSYRKYRSQKLQLGNESSNQIENAKTLRKSFSNYNDDEFSDDEDEHAIIEINLKQKMNKPEKTSPRYSVTTTTDSDDVHAKANNVLIDSTQLLDTAQRRLTLHRGDAVQRHSTPEEVLDKTLENTNLLQLSQQLINAETGESDVDLSKGKISGTKSSSNGGSTTTTTTTITKDSKFNP